MLVLKYKDPHNLLFLIPTYPTAVFSGLRISTFQRIVILQKMADNS